MRFFLYSGDFEIVAISETWLTNILTDGVLDPKGLFTIYRKDRINKAGGGVIICVFNGLNSSEIIVDGDNILSANIIACMINGSDYKINVFCFYCAPNIARQEFAHSLYRFKSMLSILAQKLKYNNW